ncbi:hypothetical protein N7495_002751 [Penicillium taxi]|uniref:uncharacterized protein n=1 Tax=Penicillium taxi TaxID=168475 RepID=UPI0025451572|nr:uncharacterized protein N7495_002751 [Penicillium taxi]KAJ5902223.1 hypothetical protein N7495_002751 [Penicillium taxi]
MANIESDAYGIDLDVAVAVDAPDETVAAAIPAAAAGIKRAACLSRRSIKIKCVRSSSQATVCNRCLSKGVKCSVPDYRVGRRKGVPNKRRGLGKAIHQLQQALNDPKTLCDGPDNKSVLRLQRLLGEAGAVINHHHHNNEPSHSTRSTTASASNVPSPSSNVHATFTASSLVHEEGSSLLCQEDTLLEPLLVEDTENPLQLLAHATEQCLQLPISSDHPYGPLASHQSKIHGRDDGADDNGLRTCIVL